MSRRGMTLVEVMIAGLIASAVMAITLSVVTTGVRLARQGEQTASSNEAARAGMDMLMRDLRLAGIPGGYFMTAPGGGGIFQINPVFTQAGAWGADDLWVVVPRPNMMEEDCAAVGSSAVVTSDSIGTVTINCKTPIDGASMLMVTNFTRAALISVPVFPTATSMTYAESGVANFCNAPEKGFFRRGDRVVPIDVYHYFIRLNANGRPELVRRHGVIDTPTAAVPFVEDTANTHEDIFTDVEDLQVAFGYGIPPNLTFESAHAIAYDAAKVTVSVRVSVVGLTQRTIIDDQNRVMEFGPLEMEDHIPPAGRLADGTISGTFWDGGIYDGYRRAVFRRRIELTNAGAVGL